MDVKSGANCSNIYVNFAVPSVASNMSSALAIPVVVLASLAVSMSLHPWYSGSAAHDASSLYAVDFSAEF